MIVDCISLLFTNIFLWFVKLYFSDPPGQLLVVEKGCGLSTCPTVTPVTILAPINDAQLYFFGFDQYISLILPSIFLWFFQVYFSGSAKCISLIFPSVFH